jgi:hypothetical protein
MLPTRPDRSPPAAAPPPAPARQLALPLGPVAAPPPLPRLGPPVPPRRVWRSLGPPAQAAVRCAVVRVYQEVCPELAALSLQAPEEVARERRAARR